MGKYIKQISYYLTGLTARVFLIIYGSCIVIISIGVIILSPVFYIFFDLNVLESCKMFINIAFDKKFYDWKEYLSDHNEKWIKPHVDEFS